MFPGAANITVAADNPTYQSYNGMLFTKELTDLLLVPEGMEGAAVLPESIASVPACVFSRCLKLSAIGVPTGSTASARFATWNGILYSKNLNAEGEPDGALTLIAAPAGLGTSATIAPECTAIAEGAFAGNHDLKTIVVNSGITTVGTQSIAPVSGADEGEGDDGPIRAFEQNVIEEATVVLTGDYPKAPWEAAGFRNFSEPAEPGETIEPAEGSGFAFDLLDDYTLAVRWQGDEPAPAALRIPAYGILNGVQYTVSAIADNAFAGQTSIITVDMPGTITHIGDAAFDGCTSLQTANLANAITRIGQRAFAGTALLSAVLPTSLTSLGDAAFGDLNGTTVVALCDLPDAADAFAGSHGLSIYVPLRADGDYGLGAGLPASGNHIYPYGVSLGADAATLEEGQTADLFAGGYLEAPGDVQVDYTYKASPLSVDTQTGQVEAKQFGNSNVAVALSLRVPTVYVNAITATDARLEPASYSAGAAGEGDAAIGDVVPMDTTVPLASTAALYTVNAANAGIATAAAGDTIIQGDLTFTELADGTYSVRATNKSTITGDVVIPSKIGKGKYVTTIPSDAFSRTNITSIYIPATVVSIGSSGFVDLCNQLKSIEVAPSSNAFVSYDGVLYSKDSSGNIDSLLRYPGSKTDSHFEIMDGTTKIGNSALCDNQYLKGVSIPDSVTYIAEWFLTNMPNLESVTIPDSVTTLKLQLCAPYGGSAIQDFKKLKSVTLGTGVTAIKASSFATADAITDIYARGTITSIDSTCFTVLDKTKCTVHLLDGSSKAVWQNAGFTKFSNYGDVLKFTQIAEGELSVEAKNASTLTGDVIIPETWSGKDAGGNNISGKVTAISGTGFRYSAIKSLRIPATIKTIPGGRCFDLCVHLESIEVDSANPYFASYNGVLYSKAPDGKIKGVVRYPAAKTSSNVTIMDGTTTIHDAAFTDNPNIRTIAIPDSVTQLGAWFLTNIPNLETLIIPDAVSSFYGNICSPYGYKSESVTQNKQLVSVTLGKGITKLIANGPYRDQYAASFETASNLKDIYVRGIITRIDEHCFQATNKDTCVVHLPDGASEDIWRARGFKLFKHASDDLIFGQIAPGELNVAARDRSTITGDVVIPETYTGKDASGNDVSGTVVAIANTSFQGSKINSLYIPKTVVSISPDPSFDLCSQLASFEVDPENPKYLSHNGALYSKDEDGNPLRLEKYPSANQTPNVAIMSGVKSLGSAAISDNAYIRTIAIPSSVMSIVNWFPTNTPNLESLTIPDTVTSVGSKLATPYGSKTNPNTQFTKLTSVVLGKGVKRITDDSFSTATNLMDIYVRGTVDTISGNAFSGVDKTSCIVHLPDTATEAEKDVWRKAGFLIGNIDTESFSVTFEAGSGAFKTGEDTYQQVISSLEFTPGLTIRRPDYDVERAGYALDYWYTLEGGTEKKWNFATDRAYAPVTLYAKWKPVAYTVNLVSPDHPGFVDSAGQLMDTSWKVAFEASTGVAGPDFTLPRAKFRGYTLEGWYTSYDADAGTFDGKRFADGDPLNIKQYVPGYGNSAFVEGNDSYVSDANTITLYAKWTEKTYTVHFKDSPDAASEYSTAQANYETSSTAAGGTASTNSITLPEMFKLSRDGQYYTQWGTRTSGITAAAGNLVKDASKPKLTGSADPAVTSTLTIKEIVDGTGSVDYVAVPDGSNIYDVTDIYLYPQWDYIEYSLAYKENYSTTGSGKPMEPVDDSGNAIRTNPADIEKITYREDGIYLNGVKQESGIALGEPTGFGDGYAFAKWTKSATASSNTLPSTITKDNFTQIQSFNLKFTNTASGLLTKRPGTAYPQWTEFTYDVVLYNTDATGTPNGQSKQTYASSTSTAQLKYSSKVMLPVPPASVFTVPNGMKAAANWKVDAPTSSAEIGVTTSTRTVPVSELVALTAADKGSTAGPTELKLYMTWVDRTDLKYTVYYVYEGLDAQRGTYPDDPQADAAKTKAYTGQTNGAAIGLTDGDKVATKNGFVFDDAMSTWKNDPAHGGFATVQGNDSVLFAYFKKQYSVDFAVGAGGGSAVEGGLVQTSFTYTHADGANAGTPAKMSEAIAELRKVADFETPAPGHYFDGYVFTGDYVDSTLQTDNTGTFELDPSGDIDADISYTAVFKAIDYQIKYRHAYDSALGMQGTPDDSALVAKHFIYDDLAEGAQVPLTNADNAGVFAVPVGYQHVGWMRSDDPSAAFDTAGAVALMGDAGNTFADLGFSAAPAAAHQHWQDVVLDATWDYRTYTLQFWKFTDKESASKVTVQGGAFDTARFTLDDTADPIVLPDQDSATGDEDHPYIDDTLFGYALVSWSTAATPTGEVPETSETLLGAGESWMLSQLLFGREEGLRDTATEPEGGVINLYATWNPVYSVSVPATSQVVSFDIDLATGQPSEAVEATVQSETPRPIAVDAYSEVIVDPADVNGWQNSTAAQLFVPDADSAYEGDIQDALAKIALRVSGETAADKQLSLHDPTCTPVPVIDRIAPASELGDADAQAHPTVQLELNGAWVNPSLRSAEAPDEEGTVFKRWGNVARIVWIISELDRDLGQHLYPDEATAYPTE